MILISGKTGSGKTNYAVWRLLQAAEEAVKGNLWIIAVFPHPQAGISFISELYARFGKGILPHLLVDRVTDMDRVLMRRLILSSIHLNDYKMMMENEEFCGNFMDMLARGREIHSWTIHPVLEKYARLAVQIYQTQDSWISESLLSGCLMPKTPPWDYFIDHCRDKRVRYEFLRMMGLNAKDQLTLLEPAKRLLEQFLSSAPIIARTSRKATFDRVRFLNGGGILVILGGPEEALRILVAADFQETCFLAKHGALKIPGIYCLDEVNNYRLVGLAESKALSTMRAFGVDIWLICQSFDFPVPEIKRNILQNTDHLWFNCGDWELAQEGARDLLGALDEMKVHHTTQRQIHLGNIVQERGTRSSSKSSDGRKTETKGISFVSIPEYVTHEESAYESGAEQLIWKAQELQELPVGTCWARKMGRKPWRMNVPLVEDSWYFPAVGELKSLSEEKVEELLCLVKAKPEYQVPMMVELPAKVPTPMAQNATKPSSNGSGRSSRQQRSRR